MSGENSRDPLSPPEPGPGSLAPPDGDDEATVADLRRARGFGTTDPPPSAPEVDTIQLDRSPSGPPATGGVPSSRPPAAPEAPRSPSDPPPLDSIPPSGNPGAETTTTGASLRQEPSSVATTGSEGLLRHEALQREREERSVMGLRSMGVLSLVGALAMQFAPDKPITHYPATFALVLLAAMAFVGSWLLAKHRIAEGGAGSVVLLLGATLVILSLVAHMGVLSPVPMGLALLVYFDGTSDHRRRGLAVFITAAAGYLLLTFLAAAGVIPALLPAKERLNPRAVLLLGLTGEGMLVTAYAVAVMGRKRTLEAMERLESAQREIRRRQALLDEARADLDRALDAARVGRFTDQEIGPFLANDVIGRGGMGEVYRGIRIETGEVVAIKVLHAQYRSEQDQLERFFREAEATSSLDSPHIVRVQERGYAADGSPYIAMELLAGYDLAQALRKHTRLGLSDVITMVTQVAAGLAAAQEAGIVHRDVKPQNVFRARVGSMSVWKVLDFGVSKMGDVAGTLTHGAIVGTPGYMSPEQARGKSVDHRSDVFSLAVLAYRALTGKPPFHASDPLGTTYQVVHSMPVQPSEIVKLQPDIDLVLAIALAKDKEDRFRSATSFAAALRDASRGELDERMRTAARDLLRHHPWGTERRA